MRMTITSIEVIPLAIPFRVTFSHALASRDRTDSLIVRARGDDGAIGYGECAPRLYVTGETSDAAHQTIERQLAPQWRGAAFDRFEDLVDALRKVQHSLRRNQHAAFCALELALLDLAGKTFHRSAGDILGPVTRPRAWYSGIVTADTVDRVAQYCNAFKAMHLHDIKVKVGRSETEDCVVLQTVRDIMGDDCSLRVDANGAWTADEALDRLQQYQRFRIDAIEQPVPAGDHFGLARVALASAIPVVADESLVSIEDAETLIDARACHIFNIRVSKNGGLIGSQRLRERAARANLGWMLGAQVGETAILSAAGRHLATRGEAPRWCEGSFGSMLLQQDLTSQNITFAPGGAAPALLADGLGAAIVDDRVDAWRGDAAMVPESTQPYGAIE